MTAGQSLVTYVWKDDIPSAVVYAPNSPGNPGNGQERIVYLHTDHLDTPRKATDATGRVVWTWESDAFGSNAALDDPDNDGIKTVVNLRLPGQYFDAESGLHYNWHRYYDPLVGRYTQSDPIGLEGGMNAYNYAENNPLGMVDPDGRLAWWVIPAGLLAYKVGDEAWKYYKFQLFVKGCPTDCEEGDTRPNIRCKHDCLLTHYGKPGSPGARWPVSK